MKVLLTGFEPFGGRSANPSGAVVQALASALIDGIELHTAVLPVEHHRGPQALLDVYETIRPEAVVCLGEAGGRLRISFERVAINLVDSRIPDNTGVQWVDQQVVPGGPTAYFTTLPVKDMLSEVLKAGIPAELSLTAGAFLCNQVCYAILHHVATQNQAVPVGFVHLPLLPEQAVEQQLSRPESGSVPTMSLDLMVSGIKAALSVLLV